jgi:CcmD family protein
MGAWGFVLLAYGIVWTAILLYLFLLKRRFHKAQAELALLQAMQGSHGDAQT